MKQQTRDKDKKLHLQLFNQTTHGVSMPALKQKHEKQKLQRLERCREAEEEQPSNKLLHFSAAKLCPGFSKIRTT